MPGHSRSKNGVASLAYVPGIHVLIYAGKDVDGRDKPGHDGIVRLNHSAAVSLAGLVSLPGKVNKAISGRLIAAWRVGVVILAPSRSVT